MHGACLSVFYFSTDFCNSQEALRPMAERRRAAGGLLIGYRHKETAEGDDLSGISM